jgi:hypothetical protein
MLDDDTTKHLRNQYPEGFPESWYGLPDDSAHLYGSAPQLALMMCSRSEVKNSQVIRYRLIRLVMPGKGKAKF